MRLAALVYNLNQSLTVMDQCTELCIGAGGVKLFSEFLATTSVLDA